MLRLIQKLLGLDWRDEFLAIKARVEALEDHIGINGAVEATDDLGKNGR